MAAYASLFGTPSGLPFGVTGRDTPALPVAPAETPRPLVNAGPVRAESDWFSVFTGTAQDGGRPFGVAPDGTIPTAPAPTPTTPDPAFLPPDWKPGNGLPVDLLGKRAEDVPVEFVPPSTVNSPEFQNSLRSSVLDIPGTSGGADTSGVSGGGGTPPTYPKAGPIKFPTWLVVLLLGGAAVAAWRWRK